ncbi:hypothetical protein OUY22_30020 [Nonomuraea sp. MCN248]|uniref:DUF1795 domain-containing protein n=1 Tax=Nonomuraea corallina TaxID=2989783 RepID=A0ABT4SKY8_9ACTN|nr:hypothetical protein [Nonomuraea corallina]MDA0637665.1 hypothetical protein [Nonomuraea corallina]
MERDDRVRTRWDSLPPSARMHGTPAHPGPRLPGRALRRAAWPALAIVAALALVAALAFAVPRVLPTGGGTTPLIDTLAGVRLELPPGWADGKVAPVTGFTAVARDDDGGGVVMTRPLAGPVKDPGESVKDAVAHYARLLLQGDRVKVVDDRPVARGHTRAVRAQYDDVVNRPAYLRVTLVTHGGGAALVLGLLQPEETAARQALDAVMASAG